MGGGAAELGQVANETVHGALKGATIAELILEGGAAAASSEALAVLAVGIVGTYAVDQLTDGKVSQTFGKLVGCTK